MIRAFPTEMRRLCRSSYKTKLSGRMLEAEIIQRKINFQKIPKFFLPQKYEAFASNIGSFNLETCLSKNFSGVFNKVKW